MSDLKFEDSDFRAALRRGEEERAQTPTPSAVRFDAQTGRLIVEFGNGAALLIPARALQGLEDAAYR